MENTRTMDSRKAYWMDLAEKTSKVRVTDFEMGVLLGMSTRYDLDRTEAKKNERKNA